MKRFIFSLLIAFISIGIGVGLGALFFNSKSPEANAKSPADCVKDTEFINPLLECDPVRRIRKTGYADLKAKLERYIDSEKKSGAITHASIYFRDLHNGPLMGIEDQTLFRPASLLKVPILIAYLQLAEADPSILKKQLRYTGVIPNENQSIEESKTIKPDVSYPIEDLFTYMIVYSDNRAKELLKRQLSTFSTDKTDLLVQTYINLGLIEQQDPKLEFSLSVRQYAGLFRLLYHASYLSEESSEKAFELLSNVEFEKGLVAGVPKGTKVAHKFGEYSEKDYVQLHDCGIIYYQTNPYSLCVMTRGREYPKLESVIAEISRRMWEEVSSRQL